MRFLTDLPLAVVMFYSVFRESKVDDQRRLEGTYPTLIAWTTKPFSRFDAHRVSLSYVSSLDEARFDSVGVQSACVPVV
jgi:hypothetical protein